MRLSISKIHISKCVNSSSKIFSTFWNSYFLSNFYLVFASIEIENADELQKDLRASIPFINDKVTAPQEDPEIIKRLKSERDELLKVRNQKNTQMSEAIKLMRLLKGELEEPDLLPNIDHNQKFLDSIFR